MYKEQISADEYPPNVGHFLKQIKSNKLKHTPITSYRICDTDRGTPSLSGRLGCH